ncbi:MAG: response regulator, partial [Actinobacteria bacterium]
MQSGSSTTPVRRVLVVDDDPDGLEGIRTALAGAGHAVDTVHSGQEALARLETDVPDLVISDVDLPAVDGFELLTQLRSRPTTQAVPLILVSQRNAAAEDAVRGLRLGADDYVRRPIEPAELVARVEAKFERPPVPATMFPRHPGTPLLSTLRFHEELNREIERFNRTGRSGCLAALDLAERQSVVGRLGPRADRDLRVQVSALAAGAVGNLDLVGVDTDGRLLVLMPETDPEEASGRLLHLSERITAGSFTAVGEPITVTAVAGFAVLGPDTGEVDGYIQRAVAAAAVAAEQMDLQPVRWTPEIEAANKARTAIPWVQRVRTPAQALLSLVLGVAVPFLGYVGAERVGVPLAGVTYLVVVGALLVTGTLIWVEGFLALRPEPAPPEPATPYPPASAVIAAYLPNEAATVVETVEAMLRVDYPGPFQVVLAYNTPQPMPVEAVLAEIAAREPRFVPYRVEASTSKAQNVNAALSVV